MRQAKTMGIDRAAVLRRVTSGQLHVVHRGVYAVGHEGLSQEGRWMAAVLGCGEGAVLSHISAAALWDLLRQTPGPVHVSVPTRNGRRQRAGIRLHRCASLGAVPPSFDTEPNGASPLLTVRHGIPVTTPARTVADLETSVEPRLARRARRQAELACYSLGPGGPRRRTRSDFEDDFLDLCRAHGLPRPQVNVQIGRWTVDFIWPDRRLAVETDSYRFHRGSVAFEDDHARDLDLRARGVEVRRFTERQIHLEPLRVAADLRAAFERP
jgi:very-short-patch-repair endonuclease